MNEHDEVDYEEEEEEEEEEIELIDDLVDNVEVKNQQEYHQHHDDDDDDETNDEHKNDKSKDKKSSKRDHKKNGHSKSSKNSSSVSHSSSTSKRRRDSIGEGGDDYHKKKSKSSKKSAEGKDDYDDNYFRRSLYNATEGFRDPHDKSKCCLFLNLICLLIWLNVSEHFIANLWKSVEGKLVHLSAYSTASECIAWLMDNVSIDDDIFASALYELDFDQHKNLDMLVNFTCHGLVENVLATLNKHLSDEASFQTTSAQMIIKFIESYGHFIADNMPDVLRMSPNRLTRALITLGGLRANTIWRRRNMLSIKDISPDAEVDSSSCQLMFDTPLEFKDCLVKIADALLNSNMPNQELRAVLFGSHSYVVQHLLLIAKLRTPELCQRFIMRLAEVSFDNNRGCEVIETMLLLASPNQLTKSWDKEFKVSLVSNQNCRTILIFIVCRNGVT